MKKTIKMANVISSDIRSRKNADKIHAMIAPGDEWKVELTSCLLKNGGICLNGG